MSRDFKQKSPDTKKQETAIHIQQKSDMRWPRCWNWQVKTLKQLL